MIRRVTSRYVNTTDEHFTWFAVFTNKAITLLYYAVVV